MKPTYIYKVVEAIKIIDGDTYIFRVDLGFRAFIVLNIRLHGWNCPELKTVEGKMAQSIIENWIHNTEEIVIQSYKDQRSFERWVCDVWLDGNSLGELIGQANLGNKI